MNKLIKVYRWENGQILEKEICKSDLKHTMGWRTEPDEAMFSQLEMKRYVLENSIEKIKQQVNEICKLEEGIENLGINAPKLMEENHFGLSTQSIKLLIDELNVILLNNYKQIIEE